MEKTFNKAERRKEKALETKRNFRKAVIGSIALFIFLKIALVVAFCW